MCELLSRPTGLLASVHMDVDNGIVILYDENKTEPFWLQPRAGQPEMDGRRGGEK
jgi:hypothetical protein